MNPAEALDEYLLGLLAEAVEPPASVAVAADAPASVSAAPATAVTEVSEAPEVPAQSQAPIAVAKTDFTADLLAEMDADPAFATAGPATPAAPAKTDFTADLLAEMDADPAFAAAGPATPAAPAKTDFTADLLAEMDADPAFATAGPAAPAAPAKTDFTADLLAEMDADPAFAAAGPAQATRAEPAKAAVDAAPAIKPTAKPTASTAGPIGPVARRPAPRAAALPPHIQAMFQPAPVVSEAHRRASDRSTRWLRLRCGEQTYALELLKVQEVVLPVPLLPLRGAARSILGIMNLRGQVVPVLDLGLHLGAGPVADDAQTRVVVLEENGETMGLRVSAVEDVTSLSEHHIEPPDNTRLCRISNHLFRGVARLGQQPMILLDARELLH